MRAAAICAGVLAAWAVAACGGAEETEVPGGDADRGRALIVDYGCGTCHTIAGIDEANATVGPELTDFASNRYLAGELPNNPENAIRWIMNPRAISPDTIMPDLGVTESEARDIVTYLYQR